MNSRALALATVVGTVLQLAMVIAGHSNKSIAALFAVGGMGISLMAGLLYALFAKSGSTSSLAVGGLLAGGLCALLGIIVSCLLGDVTAIILVIGTASSAVTGLLGGLLGKLFVRGAAVAALMLMVGGTPRDASAQTQMVAGHAGPTTTIKDFSWLVGRWEGRMKSMAGVADVTFAPASAGLMTGMMRLVDGDKVLVVELISMVDTPTGPALRFRHFSSELEAYETSFKQNMRFVSHLSTDDVFENAVPFEKGVMSTQPRVTTYHRVDADTFIGHSDIIGDDGKPGVVEVTYRRVK